MESRRYKDILAIRTHSHTNNGVPNTTNTEIIGFHARNLEIAKLSESMWQALADEQELQKKPEIREELEEWQNETCDATTDEIRARGVRTLLLNIAQICNLKCTYCAATNLNGDNRSAGTYGSPVTKIDTKKAEEQIHHFLGALKNVDTNDGDRDSRVTPFEIEFCGGEPLLYPKVIESLCGYATLMSSGGGIDLHFAINTNGTLITREVADMLAAYKFHVTISLDGDPTVNDVTRPAKSKRGLSSTELTLKGLHELKRVRDQLGSLNVNCVFGSHNTHVERAFDFLESLDLNFDRYNFNFSNNDHDRADAETAGHFSNLYLDELKKTAAKLYARDGFDGLIKIKQFRRPLSRLASQTRAHNYCGAGKTLIQSDTRADLYVCNWFMNDPREKIGHLTEISEPLRAHYDADLIELNRCETCWARHLCGGGCMAVHKAYSGDRHMKDPNFCHRTREIAVQAIYYYSKELA